MLVTDQGSVDSAADLNTTENKSEEERSEEEGCPQRLHPSMWNVTAADSYAETLNIQSKGDAVPAKQTLSQENKMLFCLAKRLNKNPSTAICCSDKSLLKRTAGINVLLMQIQHFLKMLQSKSLSHKRSDDGFNFYCEALTENVDL